MVKTMNGETYWNDIPSEFIMLFHYVTMVKHSGMTEWHVEWNSNVIHSIGQL